MNEIASVPKLDRKYILLLNAQRGWAHNGALAEHGIHSPTSTTLGQSSGRGGVRLAQTIDLSFRCLSQEPLRAGQLLQLALEVLLPRLAE